MTLEYSDNTANMIAHTRCKHGHLTAPTTTPSASNIIAIVSRIRDSGPTIAIILRLLFYYRDSIAIVKSPAIVAPSYDLPE